MEIDKGLIIQTLTDYLNTFSTLDMEGIAPFYHEPCMAMTAQGVFVMATYTEMKVGFAPIIQNLKTRNYGWSKWDGLHFKHLSDQIALASATVVRYTKNGEVLERLGSTYGLYHTSTGWKISLLITHNEATAISFG